MNHGRSSNHSEAHVRDFILDVAEGFARRGGYFCFDMADVAEKADIPEPIVRGHFEDQESLMLALIQRYTVRLREAIGDPNEAGSLDPLVSVLSAAAKDGDEMCLCSLYGAEAAALSERVVAVTKQFFSVIIDWIGKTLKCEEDSKHPEAILASLCGALLTVRSNGNPEAFEGLVRQLVEPILNQCKGHSLTKASQAFGGAPEGGS